ncbi:type IV pilus modification protein PilV [Spectribacter hydrogenoxidans]|uniref:Type IV pilus modification protein PilV n=1 Tax=Spectribacter hydrogenoxidans TaxID=3075608 RepID=A0ABU3C1G9_9GAMM|nr:type IV pilus modification protein PilV [Salinisphaera sp. W335]MDT0635401.1 type IV pilus modification protein PilV [Salinisphaera sp. W335]
MTRQRGFTLLEALIALVVVSIGLLGLLGLQAVSLSNTHVSATRTTANDAAKDIAERMRSNLAGVDANHYADIDHPSAGKAPGFDCVDSSCSAQQMATVDAYAWDQSIGAQLPNGRGRVDCLDNDPADGDACSRKSPHRVTVIWRERDRQVERQGIEDFDACDDEDDEIDQRCFQLEFVP